MVVLLSPQEEDVERTGGALWAAERARITKRVAKNLPAGEDLIFKRASDGKECAKVEASKLHAMRQRGHLAQHSR